MLAFGTAGQIASPLRLGALYFPFGYQAAYLAVGLPALAVAVLMLRGATFYIGRSKLENGIVLTGFNAVLSGVLKIMDQRLKALVNGRSVRLACGRDFVQLEFRVQGGAHCCRRHDNKV
ncbi:MAG: hypothetical protein O2967_14245 [Proteobacteria bacterium]|nr:hypothetical protein [Pseudomonadota bacterium]